MNFLTRILAVDIPDNTSLQSWDFSFRGLTIGWLLLLVFIVFCGMIGVAFFYLLERGTVGWIRRIMLFGLRCGLLFLLLFLILRPVILLEFVGERPLGVALLLDNSESMTQRDRRQAEPDKARVAISMAKLPLDTPVYDKMPSIPDDLGLPKDPERRDIVKNILTHPELKLVESLQKFGPLRPFYVAGGVRGIRSDDKDEKDLVNKIIASMSANEDRTALADGIVKILQAKDVDLPSAIVVITDGQDNASKFTLQEAALECRRAGVPLHIYGVGSAEAGQLQIREVGAPDTLFVEDTIALPLRWRAQGFKKGEGEITITLGGKEMVKKKVNLQTGADLRDVLSFVVPKDQDKRENQDLVATIQYKIPGDPTPYKDTMKRTVRVADSKIKILYIEHGPRWEFKFLQPALQRDRRVEVDFILVNADPKVAAKPPYLKEFPETREKFFEAKYNLIILGDVNSSYFKKEQEEWIREFVKEGRGLIVMAGRQNMPNTYENTPIAEVLPVEFKKEKIGIDSEVRTKEYPPTLTETGQRTDWLALDDTPEENLEVWQKKLQGFHWHFPVTKLKPAATALIVNPRAAKIGAPPLPMPVLATHYYGKGQVLWFGTDETWRWRWNYQDKYFVRFWGQIIYQLGLPSLLGDGAKRAQMSLEHSQPVVDKQSKIFVRLLDKDFNPRKDEKVEAELEFMDAKGNELRKTPIMLHARKGFPGEYTAFITHQKAGRFELRVRNPEVNTFSFRVELPPKHEMEQAGLAEKALREAAEISGGRFYREEDLHHLASSLEVKTKEFRRHQEVVLWNPLAVLLFLGLITMEWLIRKFSDLS